MLTVRLSVCLLVTMCRAVGLSLIVALMGRCRGLQVVPFCSFGTSNSLRRQTYTFAVGCIVLPQTAKKLRGRKRRLQFETVTRAWLLLRRPTVLHTTDVQHRRTAAEPNCQLHSDCITAVTLTWRQRHVTKISLFSSHAGDVFTRLIFFGVFLAERYILE